MTETRIQNLGFKIVKNYTHDEWRTVRYKKGVIQAEFTYNRNTKKLESFDITIDEIVGMEINDGSLIMLDSILNGNHS